MRNLGKSISSSLFNVTSHPSSTLKEAVALAEYLRDIGYMPEQVQDFYPTPSTMSTVMYYTGINPANMKPVYVCKNPHEKAMQRALIQYRNPKNYDLVYEALIAAHREDLIGFDKKCLIKPRKIANRSTKEKVIQQGKRKTKDSMQNNKNKYKDKINNKNKSNEELNEWLVPKRSDATLISTYYLCITYPYRL